MVSETMTTHTELLEIIAAWENSGVEFKRDVLEIRNVSPSPATHAPVQAVAQFRRTAKSLGR